MLGNHIEKDCGDSTMCNAADVMKGIYHYYLGRSESFKWVFIPGEIGGF